MNERQFKKIANVDPHLYYKIKENMKSAKKIRDENHYNCGLYASYIQYNTEESEGMQKAIREVAPFVDGFYSLPLYNQAGKIKNDEWEFVSGNPGRYDNKVPPVPCWVLFQEGHINVNGTLNACSFVASDDFVMGDLTREDFMQAWNSKKFQALRQKHLEKNLRDTPCKECFIHDVK